ncbi:hypothetical protein D7X33_19190 [Butyricicoccus sp. 1XD8-22]|nr:hypothetical protein D7X33_19190 [Butyricicoccus sp. 1XD8-22]
MLKFKAKAFMSCEELNDLGIEHENGWVKGSWVDEHWIIGEVIEATDEYFAPSFWVKIDPSTVTQTDLMQTLKSPNSY